MPTTEEKLRSLRPVFDRKIRFAPYKGPEKIPTFQRRHLLRFSTTPPPVLTIPNEIFEKAAHILASSKDVTAEIEALGAEYEFYYAQRVSEMTRVALKAASETETEKAIPAKQVFLDVNAIMRQVVGVDEASAPWQEMQQRFRSDIATLEARPGGCSACSRNAVIQKYRAQVIAAITRS